MKHLVVLFLAFCVGAIFANCTQALGITTTDPFVIIDEAFTPEEIGAIMQGVAEWHNAVPQFRFHLSSAEHANIIGQALSGDEGVIYIVRNKGTLDRDCPSSNRQIGDENVAITNSKYGYAIICMDSVYIDQHSDPLEEWKRVTMHEVGHAMGMPHRPVPSVMAIPDSSIAPTPSTADILYIKGLWGLS